MNINHLANTRIEVIYEFMKRLLIMESVVNWKGRGTVDECLNPVGVLIRCKQNFE